MRLLSLRLSNVGPFADTTVRLADGTDDEPAKPRPVTVLFGADGIGKTTLLASLAVTRPGYAIPPPPAFRAPAQKPPRSVDPSASTRAAAAGAALAALEETPPSVVTEWLLGDDDPERPHPLVVASPSAVLAGETPEAAIARRREQSLFERRAQSEGGFVFVGFSGARWFSRTTNMLTTPERTILRYDVRHPATFDDPTRADLARETKQVLAYASIARALGDGRAEHAHFARFDAALHEVVDVMLEPFGLRWSGTNPTSLEPEARDGARVVPFDALPRPARHLVAFGALTTRALFAAYPGADEPRACEGVAAIDDVESQQDPSLLRALVPLLRKALPNVQWILTTASTQLALSCTQGEVVALRRTEERIEVGEGLMH